MIECRFKKVDDTFKRLSEKYKENLENAKIKPIHPKFPFAQNGICAFIATIGSGKTYRCLILIAQQEVLGEQPFFETAVFCSTSGEFDETSKTFKKGIRKTNVINVKDDELMDFLNEYTNKIKTYNTIMVFVKNGLKDPDEEMLKLLRENGTMNRKGEIDIIRMITFISNKLTEIGWKTHPHRLLLVLEDFASHPLLKRKEDPLSRFLKKLRHFHINVIICVQTTKSIPKDLKRNLTDVILFPGINEEDFKFLVRESTVGKLGSPDELWEQYRKIKTPQTMIGYHVSADKIIITPPS